MLLMLLKRSQMKWETTQISFSIEKKTT